MTLLEAVSIAVAKVKIKEKTKVVPLKEAYSLILASDFHSRRDMPSFDNSAMDGYALGANTNNDIYTILKDQNDNEICIFAGEELGDLVLGNATALKIMTGAIVPPSATTIAPIEIVEKLDDSRIKASIKTGLNIRYKGEELKKGEVLVKAGTKLKSAALTQIISTGTLEIEVKSMPKICIYSSGDEVFDPFITPLEDLKPHQIYNTNAFMLVNLLKEMGFSAEYGGILADKKEVVLEFLQDIKNSDFDVFITTGGASMGDADFFALFKRDVIFSKIDMKPGKHITLSQIGDKLLFNLPGNPLASNITARLIVVPLLSYFYQSTKKGDFRDLEDFLSIKYQILEVSLDEKFRTKMLEKQGVNGLFITSGIVKNMIFTPLLPVSSASLEALKNSDAIGIVTNKALEDGKISIILIGG